MRSDREIADAVTPQPITEIAAQLGLTADDLLLYGTTKAKIRPEVRERPRARAVAYVQLRYLRHVGGDYPSSEGGVESAGLSTLAATGSSLPSAGWAAGASAAGLAAPR